MILFLAQSTANAGNLVNELHAFVPFDQMVILVAKLMPAFYVAAYAILVPGYMIQLDNNRTPFKPTVRLGVLVASIAASTWFLQLLQMLAGALVNSIGQTIPALNWLIVNNPSDAAMALNFSQPYQKIGQWVAGQFPTDRPPPWDLGKNADFLMRQLFIFGSAAVAALTVAFMEIGLIIQKGILIYARPVLPLTIGGLLLPAADASCRTSLKFLVAVCLWPVGWALAHVGTMAGLQSLHPPAWNADFGTLFYAFLHILGVFLWMVVATLLAVWATTKAVTAGGSFGAAIVSGFASAGGQHAQNLMKSTGAVAGGALGSLGGFGGAVVGAAVGRALGGAAAAPVGAATQVAEGTSDAGRGEGRHPIPRSRSSAAADAALAAILRSSP